LRCDAGSAAKGKAMTCTRTRARIDSRYTAARRRDLKAGGAAFVPPDAGHSHSNPGTSVNRWYFISIRPNTARTAPATFPGQKACFGYGLASKFITKVFPSAVT
jgi:hypothetical protein